MPRKVIFTFASSDEYKRFEVLLDILAKTVAEFRDIVTTSLKVQEFVDLRDLETFKRAVQTTLNKIDVLVQN